MRGLVQCGLILADKIQLIIIITTFGLENAYIICSKFNPSYFLK